MRALASLSPLLLLAGCGSGADDAPDDIVIPPGVYSSVVRDDAGGLNGYELRLAQGSDSARVDYTQCLGTCLPLHTAPVKRGRGGVSFTLPSGGERLGALATVQAVEGAVMLSMEGDSGLASHRLAYRGRAMGLDAADGTGAVTPPRP